MVIDDKANEDEAMEEDVAGAAYKESLTSVDGFTRGPHGRVKFNKDTKKRRRENEEEDENKTRHATRSTPATINANVHETACPKLHM